MHCSMPLRATCCVHLRQNPRQSRSLRLRHASARTPSSYLQGALTAPSGVGRRAARQHLPTAPRGHDGAGDACGAHAATNFTTALLATNGCGAGGSGGAIRVYTQGRQRRRMGRHGRSGVDQLHRWGSFDNFGDAMPAAVRDVDGRRVGSCTCTA